MSPTALRRADPGRAGLAARRSAWARVPWNALSRLTGRLARKQLPVWARPLVIGGFARLVGADLDEAELPIGEYARLEDFFIRRIKPGRRLFPADPEQIVSPVDGRVSARGRIEDDLLLQVKGSAYRLDELILHEAWARRFRGGSYLTIYLAPGDYHRIHSPAAGRVRGLEHVPGTLFPVNRWGLRRFPGLFATNERVTTFLETAAGMLAVVKVGAANVGGIRVKFHPLTTNRPWNRYSYTDYSSAGIALERGEEFARFELGSTVILLLECGAFRLQPPPEGARIRLGAPVAAPLGREPAVDGADALSPGR
jgi:phosphatidylserine decarboxylase